MKTVISNIKNLSLKLVRLIQKISVTFFLFIIYAFGLGITRLFLLVFNRKVLDTRGKKLQSYWEEASNLGDHNRQS